MAPKLFNHHYPCPKCRKFHGLRVCQFFVSMPIEKRIWWIVEKGFCRNCLAQNHQEGKCTSIDRCRKCFATHNTLLHPIDGKHVWFQMTAVIRLSMGGYNKKIFARVLIDPNMARSSICVSLVKKHQFKQKNGRVMVFMAHRDGNRVVLEALCAIEDHRNTFSPARHVSKAAIPKFHSEADPEWSRKQSVHMVLGADVFDQLSYGHPIVKPGKIHAMETTFGWAFFGVGFITDPTNDTPEELPWEYFGIE